MDLQIKEEECDDDWESLEDLPGITPTEFVTEGKEPKVDDLYEMEQA